MGMKERIDVFLRRERNWLRERDSVLNGRGVEEDGVGIVERKTRDWWEESFKDAEKRFGKNDRRI